MGKFTQASAILNRVIEKNVSKKGFGGTGLLFRWDDIVGSDVSKVARPIKIYPANGGKDTILRIQVNRAHAPQISLNLEHIKVKINHFFGYNAVSKVLIQQAGPYDFTINDK